MGGDRVHAAPRWEPADMTTPPVTTTAEPETPARRFGRGPRQAFRQELPPGACEAVLPESLTPYTSFLLAKLAQAALEQAEHELAERGLGVRQFGVLSVLDEAGGRGLSQQELGARLRIDRTRMVTVVDDLERLGLAERRANPADRRAHAVALTPRGHGALVEARAVMADLNERLLAPLGAEDAALLHGLLARLVETTVPPCAPAGD